jgi:hypothetical protein
MRAARRSERPRGRFRSLLAVFFTGASAKPPATPEPATAEPPAKADWPAAA